MSSILPSFDMGSNFNFRKIGSFVHLNTFICFSTPVSSTPIPLKI